MKDVLLVYKDCFVGLACITFVRYRYAHGSGGIVAACGR